MYRTIALALGLLAVPAAAGTFDRHECATVEAYFNICAASLEENDGDSVLADVSYKWLRHGRNGMDAIEARLHPEDPHRLKEHEFERLCRKVCYEEMTAQQAYRKFCRRPATEADVKKNIGDALCEMTARNGSNLCPQRPKP
jgi:hypothetical protein